MSRKKNRPIGDIESRIKAIDLRVEAFEQLARDFNLVIEPVRLPEPERPVAVLEKPPEAVVAKPPVAVVEAPLTTAPPPQAAAVVEAPLPTGPPPVVVEAPAAHSPLQGAVSLDNQGARRSATGAPPPNPLPQAGEGAAAPRGGEGETSVVEQVPLPRAPQRPAPPPEPRATWAIVAVSVLLAVLAGGSWYAVQAYNGWRLQRAHRVQPLSFGHAALLAVKGDRVDTIDMKRGLLFTLDARGLSTRAIHKFSDGEPGGLAWGKDCLWTTLPAEGRVLQRDAAPGARVRRVFELPQTRPTSIAWDGREVWVFDALARRLRQYTIGDTLAPVRDWALEGEPAGLHVADDLVWVAEASTRRIVRYRAGPELELFDTLDLGRWLPATSRVAGFAVDAGVLWVLTESPSEIHRLELGALSRRPQVPGGRKQ